MLAFALDLAHLVTFIVLDYHVATAAVRLGLECVGVLLILGRAFDLWGEEPCCSESVCDGGRYGGAEWDGVAATAQDRWWRAGQRHGDTAGRCEVMEM